MQNLVAIGQTGKKRVSNNILDFFVHNRPGSDAALPNLKKSRRVSIAGGDRKKGGF